MLVHTVTTGLLKHYWPPGHKETRERGGTPPCTLNLGTITDSPCRGTHWIRQTAK